MEFPKKCPGSRARQFWFIASAIVSVDSAGPENAISPGGLTVKITLQAVLRDTSL